jgi:hypothetical protein
MVRSLASDPGAVCEHVWTPAIASAMVSDRTRAAWLQGCADVAQLVEHHLAKVRVAGSNPVVRSERVSPNPRWGACSLVEWPRGEATDCKSVYTGSNPVSTSGDRPGQRRFQHRR